MRSRIELRTVLIDLRSLLVGLRSVLIGALALVAANVLVVARADAVSGSITIAPGGVDFGDVATPVAGTGPTISVIISNAASNNVVRISPPRITGPNANDFAVLTTVPAPLYLRPADSYQLIVDFTPSATGIRNATITMATNDAAQPTITIPISGQGRSRSGGLGAVSGSRFVPITPTRVLDTREALGMPGRSLAGQASVLTLPATVVPASATAAVINVTAVEADGEGFVTIWPYGRPRPTASNLNTPGPGQTIANLVTAGVGPASTLAFYTSTGMDLVGDVAGFYVPSEAVAAGRFQPVTPSRLLDTRDAIGPVQPGADVTLAVAGHGGVPATGASAVLLNVTSTDGTGAGFVTVWPADAAMPVVSNLNPDRVGETIANQVVVRLPSSGAIKLHAKVPGQLVVDIVGWFTDGTAPVVTRGLFTALSPTRLLDTRQGPGGVDGTGPRPAAGSSAVVSTSPASIPADAIAVVANVTATDPLAPGFVTVWAGDVARPLASSLNVDVAGQTIPNQVTTPIKTGQMTLYAQPPTHLVVDVGGWYRS